VRTILKGFLPGASETDQCIVRRWLFDALVYRKKARAVKHGRLVLSEVAVYEVSGSRMFSLAAQKARIND
jgi:hypothetical protein